MDTKFWGPSGWILLHSIAYNYPNKPTKEEQNIYKNFYLSLKYVLPCKYCRESITQYYEELPIDTYLKSTKKLTEWIYKIHNKVNDKLRNQGFLSEPNPTKLEIDIKYKNLKLNELPEGMKNGLDFIYTITYNYPNRKSLVKKYQKDGYEIFFKLLPYVIVDNLFKSVLIKYLDKNPIEYVLTNRDTLTRWFFKFNCKLDNSLTYNYYKNICKKYNLHRVKNCKKTCRKSRKKIKY
jgi:hypothetical protein